MRCFARSGYHRTSMADIIAESRLSAGAIYGYFASKQELIYAAARSIMDRNLRELSELGSTQALSPAEIATHLIRRGRTSVPTNLMLQVWAEATVDEEVRSLFQELLASIRANIAGQLERWAAARPGRVASPSAEWAAKTTPTLIALIVGFMVQTALVNGFDEESFLAALPDLISAQPITHEAETTEPVWPRVPA